MKRFPELASDLALFALVARHGGLSAASRAAGIPKSRLSRRIMQLEERLGARLIERSSRRFAVTGLGRQILSHAEEVAANSAAAAELAAAQEAEPQGLVRVSAPIGIGPPVAALLLPVLRAHPALRVQLVLENRPVDLIEERIDIALRVRPDLEAEADFQVRPLARTRSLLVAAPEMALAVRGDTPRALEGLPTVSRWTGTGDDLWLLEGPEGTGRVEFGHRPRFGAGSFQPLLEAARAGLGVALLPDTIAMAEISSRRLVRVLPGWQTPELTLYLVHVSRRAVLRGVRVVLDALIADLPRTALQTPGFTNN
jgi:DNA-binding transcriptional LysR family regulator